MKLAVLCGSPACPLAQVSRDAEEVARASRKVRAQARCLLEQTWQASAARDALSALHELSSAIVRHLEPTRALRGQLMPDLPLEPHGGDASCCCRHVDVAPGALPRDAGSRVESTRRNIDEIRAGVARVNGMLLTAGSLADENSARAQELWCAAEALSRRAESLRERVDALHAAEPLARHDGTEVDRTVSPRSR